MEKFLMQMGRKYRLEKVAKIEKEMNEKSGKKTGWQKVEMVICWTLAILAVSYFGVHFTIYLIRLSAGQI